MKKVNRKNIVTFILAVMLVASLAFIAYSNGLIAKAKDYFDPADEPEGTQQLVVKDGDKTIVTNVEISTALKDIDEIYTEEAEVKNFYKDVKKASILGKEIPVEKLESEVTYFYTATVKVGYETSEISIEISESQIIVTLPSKCSYIVSNINVYETYESDHWYNQINAEDVLNDYDGMEADAIKQAKENGIEKTAKENLKTVISNALSCFEEQGYEIVIK